ncbi:MAG: molybdenum cofactor biosynthesis protein MoaE [Vicinamibacterales bacterium]
MLADRAAITAAKLDAGAVAALLAADDSTGEAGATVFFVGVVRGANAGRKVLWLEYESYEPLAVAVFRKILDEAATRWPDARLAIHHRVGRVEVGEASVVIAARSPHRGSAFAACRYAIERVKQVAPIWKHEFFEGGDVWIEGATADPDDEAAREAAAGRTCA